MVLNQENLITVWDLSCLKPFKRSFSKNKKKPLKLFVAVDWCCHHCGRWCDNQVLIKKIYNLREILSVTFVTSNGLCLIDVDITMEGDLITKFWNKATIYSSVLTSPGDTKLYLRTVLEYADQWIDFLAFYFNIILHVWLVFQYAN